ncbi:MAG: extensin family protein [Deltaproteobacteria bacterium]|nr:extensin family protein [Deltaproteobacteria bacterium]
MGSRTSLAMLLLAIAPSALAGCALREARPQNVSTRPAGPGPVVVTGLAGSGPLAPVTVPEADPADRDRDHDDDSPSPDPSSALLPASTGGHPGTGPAMHYAALDRATCEAELGKRKISFERVAEARGVVAPVRIPGAIGGVTFHSMLPPSQRKTSPYEIYDCRLVLALDDYAKILSKYDIVEAVHYSVYRPPSPKAVANGPGRRHSGALAIDIGWFKTKDGKTINVEKDFHGRIGQKPCGPKATPTTGLPGEASTLRALVCEAADAQLFNVMLTPDYNWPHRNHFHFEVTAGVKWVLVR